MNPLNSTVLYDCGLAVAAVHGEWNHSPYILKARIRAIVLESLPLIQYFGKRKVIASTIGEDISM